MNILQNYKKTRKEHLVGVTVRLRKEQLDAVREYDINLGLLFRTMLDESDLMEAYKNDHYNNTDIAMDKEPCQQTIQGFSEDLFTFEHNDIRYYYLNPTTMFQKHPNEEAIQIKKGKYYATKKKYDEGATHV